MGTVEKGKNAVVLHQTLAMLPVFLVELMMGIGIGWLAPMLHILKDSPTTAFTSENCAWIAALHYVTRGLMSITSIFVVDRLGRNMLFIIASFDCFLMWVLVYWSKNVYVHYVVRLLFGLSVGFHDAAAGIYIGENCSPNLRGIFSGFFLASFYFGEVIEFLLAAFFSYECVAIVNCVLGLLTVLSTFLLREPAQYLIMKGNTAKAEKNYDWLRDLRDPSTKDEFEDIKQYVLEEKDRSFSWQMFRSREVMKSLRIVLIMHFLCYFCGFSAINSFMTMALSGSAGLTNTQLTILLGVILFISISISSPYMDRFNRRTLYLYTSALMIIIHASTAALYFVDTLYEVPYFHWILFGLLTAYMSVHGMFIFPVTTVVRGELLPQNVKALGSSFAGIFSSIGGFLGVKIYLPIAESFGMHTNFIFFSLISMFMFLYVYYDLPETRGKTLTDIQRELKGVKTRKTISS